MRGRLALGIMFILVGILVLFQQLGIGDFGNIVSMWWPMLLIAGGIIQLSTKPVSKSSGIVILLIGILLQLKRLDIITVSLLSFFWPLVIIAIGISILVPRSNRRIKSEYEYEIGSANEEVINKVALFSGIKTRNISESFKGGSLIAAFGGIDLDLTGANLVKDGGRIDVTVAFGGVDIIVPPHWKVIVRGVPLFGGWSNKTNNTNYNVEGPVLIVHCFAAFGGMDVKN